MVEKFAPFIKIQGVLINLANVTLIRLDDSAPDYEAPRDSDRIAPLRSCVTLYFNASHGTELAFTRLFGDNADELRKLIEFSEIATVEHLVKAATEEKNACL